MLVCRRALGLKCLTGRPASSPSASCIAARVPMPHSFQHTRPEEATRAQTACRGVAVQDAEHNACPTQ